MASGRAIKNRIKSTRSIEQITKAVEAVSAVKMRRSEQALINARPYALSTIQLLRNLLHVLNRKEIQALDIPLVTKREIKKIALVVIASDRGLAGPFNSNVFRQTEKILRESKLPVSIITVGKKTADYFSRRKYVILHKFEGIGDYVELHETKPISEFLLGLYKNHDVDEIVLLYTNFLSALKQELVVRELISLDGNSLEQIVQKVFPLRGVFSGRPLSLEQQNGDLKHEYIFEPSPAEVLEKLMPGILDIALYHSVLEANASEHSSRMVAMKGASENASDLMGALRISYNKARQAQITKELTEITAGKEALSQ